MTAELGVGTRVWLGWCPDDEIGETAPADARCKAATIVEGPILPGTLVMMPDGREGTTHPQLNSWNVRLDTGDELMATEDVLYPIDDDEGEQEDERIRRTDAETEPA